MHSISMTAIGLAPMDAKSLVAGLLDVEVWTIDIHSGHTHDCKKYRIVDCLGSYIGCACRRPLSAGQASNLFECQNEKYKSSWSSFRSNNVLYNNLNA